MKKTLFRDALGGTVIGLLLSTIYSYFFAPVYHPLNPYSAVGLWMEQHHIHEALVVLYCAVIWSFIGLLFSLGKELFKKSCEGGIKMGCENLEFLNSISK